MSPAFHYRRNNFFIELKSLVTMKPPIPLFPQRSRSHVRRIETSLNGKIAGITVHPQGENHAGHIMGTPGTSESTIHRIFKQHKFCRISPTRGEQKEESAKCDFVIILFRSTVFEYLEADQTLFPSTSRGQIAQRAPSPLLHFVLTLISSWSCWEFKLAITNDRFAW